MAYVVIAFSFALAGGIVARIKGNSFLVWFVISGVVPIIGLFAAILYRAEADEPRRRCPTCGRVCMVYDALCTRCGTELEYTTDTLA
jgi:hypothetical protein